MGKFQFYREDYANGDREVWCAFVDEGGFLRIEGLDYGPGRDAHYGFDKETYARIMEKDFTSDIFEHLKAGGKHWKNVLGRLNLTYEISVW